MLTVTFLLKEDLYYPHPLVQDILWASLHKIVEPVLMRWPGANLREKAIRTTIEHVHYEDENTRYICIGPVNKVCKSNFYDIFCTIFPCSLLLIISIKSSVWEYLYLVFSFCFWDPLLSSSLFVVVLTGIKYALLLGRGPKLRGF